MTTTSKLFTGDEDPQDDIEEQGEAAEQQSHHEQHPPDPALDTGQAGDAAANPGDPLVGLRQAQAVDGEAGARARGGIEQARLGALELRRRQRAFAHQFVELGDLVRGGHQISRMRRAGSSRASLMLTKNNTASRPSMMRWS